EEPRAWLVAHLDSKSQSIPMLIRISSYLALMTVLFVAFGSGFLLLLGAIRHVNWNLIVIAAVIAALPSLLCFVQNKSRGALDNATGVAAVLLAARLISPEKPLGVLITSGEELDLAGARAWENGTGGAPMINCDTVDDAGIWRCMYGNRPHALTHNIVVPERPMSTLTMIGIVALGIVAEVLDFTLAGSYARKYGGSRKAAWGAIIGGTIGAIVGVPIPIIGSVIGALVGSFVG